MQWRPCRCCLPSEHKGASPRFRITSARCRCDAGWACADNAAIAPRCRVQAAVRRRVLAGALVPSAQREFAAIVRRIEGPVAARRSRQLLPNQFPIHGGIPTAREPASEQEKTSESAGGHSEQSAHDLLSSLVSDDSGSIPRIGELCETERRVKRLEQLAAHSSASQLQDSRDTSLESHCFETAPVVLCASNTTTHSSCPVRIEEGAVEFASPGRGVGSNALPDCSDDCQPVPEVAQDSGSWLSESQDESLVSVSSGKFPSLSAVFDHSHDCSFCLQVHDTTSLGQDEDVPVPSRGGREDQAQEEQQYHVSGIPDHRAQAVAMAMSQMATPVRADSCQEAATNDGPSLEQDSEASKEHKRILLERELEWTRQALASRLHLLHLRKLQNSESIREV